MKKFVVILILLLFANCAYSQTISDYLITNDIGLYNKITKGGPSGNVLAGADHFGLDHKDVAYGISYVNDQTKMWIDVQVTKHAGSDSDKWLPHEVERDFRNYYGLSDDSYVVKQINGNTIMAVGAGGWVYRWLSGNKVVHITYTDLMMEKPEPIEVVQAYLAKHPSTLPAMTLKQLRSAENTTKWIKDEMERRLWLCDKWFYQLQLGKVQQNQVYQESVKSMNIFLDYREKYFGLKAADEKNLLAGYLNSNNGTSIKAKLVEYKTWWTANKDNAIALP